MGRKILFSAQELRGTQVSSDCITVDCRHYLTRPDAGHKNYLESHIPGAVYAHLDKDLSSAVTDSSGRHPLPDPELFANFLARSGWSPGTLLVAYDDAGGAIASRLWWLMKYFGHDCGALLDGGIEAWRQAGFAFEGGIETVKPKPTVDVVAHEDLVLSTEQLIQGLQEQNIVLADARANERYTGQVEPIDLVGGHIPGAVNFPFSQVLTSNGTFKSVEEIRLGLEPILNGHRPEELVHMCGSGVTACLNLFAAELAGFPNGKLYAGSWSEWIRNPVRAITP